MLTCRFCGCEFEHRKRGRKPAACPDCYEFSRAEHNRARRLRPPAKQKPTPTEKRCPSCGGMLPASAFHKHSGRADGLSSNCRGCENAARARRLADPVRREAERLRLKSRPQAPRERDYTEERRRRAEMAGRRYMTKVEREQARFSRACLPPPLPRIIERARPRCRIARRRLIELRSKPWLKTDDRAERERLRLRLDPDFSIRRRLHRHVMKRRRGQRIADLLRAALVRGGTTSAAMFGYTIPELRDHLERQFTDGMTWERFCAGEIHIDHIRPLASFDPDDPDQMRAAWSLSNLQPLWAEDNLSKGAKLLHCA